MNGKTALIVGATGLVGEECLKLLLQSALYDNVIAATRREIKTPGVRLQNLIVDFGRLRDYNQQIRADDVFCTIGTTIAKAGSQEAFRNVDYEIPLQIARLALENGAQKFILVTAMDANTKSGIFYNRVKGELEEALKKLNYPTLIIFRPSLLLGDRKEKRTGEEIGRFVAEKLSFLFSGPLKKYRGTPVNLLALAMLNLANGNTKGLRIIENEEIFALAKK